MKIPFGYMLVVEGAGLNQHTLAVASAAVN
jgi:hypothetical protein